MRCAVYIRVSTDREEQKSSIKNQSLSSKQLATEKSWEIVEEYIDIESGTTYERENLQRLIADMRKNKFDILLTKDLSRLSRNGALSYQLRDNFIKYHIKLITLDGVINMLDDNTHMFGLYTWIYENEAQKTSDRTKAALRSQAKAGNFMGSIPPYGFYINNKQLIIRDDYTPHIVRRIFQDYLAGAGCDKIARKLTLEKVPTPSQTANKSNASIFWYGSTIKTILQNRHYIGDLVQGKETTVSVTCKKRKKIEENNLIVVPHTHDPIITREMFDTVQLMLNKRKKSRPAPQVHLFSNMLFCKDCGRAMHYRADRLGYVCGTYSRKGKDYCTSHVIKESSLATAILEDLNHLIKHTDVAYTTPNLKKIIKKEVTSLTKCNGTLQKQLTQIKLENERALKKLINEEISNEQYTAFINSDSQSTQSLEDKLDFNKLLLAKLNQSTILQSLEKIVYQKHIDTLTPTVLNLFVEKIEIQDSEHIHIHYKFN